MLAHMCVHQEIFWTPIGLPAPSPIGHLRTTSRLETSCLARATTSPIGRTCILTAFMGTWTI